MLMKFLEEGMPHLEVIKLSFRDKSESKLVSKGVFALFVFV